MRLAPRPSGSLAFLTRSLPFLTSALVFWGAAPACGQEGVNDKESTVAATPPETPAASPLILRARVETVMGTKLEIKVLGDDAEQLDRATEAAVREIRRVEDLMTDWRDSELTRLNDAAGKGPRKVPTELASIVSRAVEMHKLTGGAFDVTYAAVGALWDFKKRPAVVPDAEAIRGALRFVDASRVQVDPLKSTVQLPEGMRLGLGGIAKGYGVDRAMAMLVEHGVRDAIVDAGGDLKVLGKKFGKPWEIAIRHPRDRGRAMALLRLSNTCVVTSGDYERFFEKDGKRYHHIIDPRSGYPSTGCLSATVVAQNAEFADSLATALCVLGPEEGLRLVERLRRVEALVVGMDGKPHASSGLEGFVR